MSFIKGNTSIDLGDTPVENIFIDVYMPMANGTYVQVYLLGYKYSLDNDPNMSVNNTSIAKQLNIPLADVLAAWDFWESKHIIKKHKSENEDENNYTVEFVNLKQLYIDNNYKAVRNTSSSSADSNKESTTQNKPNSYTCSPADLVEANKVPEIRNMFVDITKIIARELAPNEKAKVIELLYKYNIDPPLIVEAFKYSKKQNKVRHILSYSSGIIRTWYDKGIFSVEQLQEYLLKQGERYGLYSRVFKALGFGSRQASEAEMKIMDSWVDKFKFDIDVILAACTSSSKTANPSINYINGILKNWHEKGVKQVSDIDRLDQKPKDTNSYIKNKSVNSTQTSSKIKTKFHLSKSRGDKYTADELEKLILNNQKQKLNKKE